LWGNKLEYLFAFTNYYFLTKKDITFVSSFTTAKKNATYKDKWGALYANVKWIFDCMNLTKNNTRYKDFTWQEKMNLNLL
jgi:hypothetical protein